MRSRELETLKTFLDKKVEQYNKPSFIATDPVSIPHIFSKKQDIEIAGFFAAIFSWGNRTTIINKSRELLNRMDNAPYDFCLHHKDSDLKGMTGFAHRTFNDTDLLYFIDFFNKHYFEHDSLESAFFSGKLTGNTKVETGLNHFRQYFFSLEHIPARTKKHVASPQTNSSCKRLNMFLRWMVRKDKQGVDFGIWKKIKPADLVCPVDVHVARVARHFKLLERKPVDWKAAMELTERLRTLDGADPVKYDFALFGLGVMEKF
jgi:uncharacterized protein (TIGR02757 family)